MIVFNIERYGDFGMPTTALVMAAPEGMTKQMAKQFAKTATETLRNTDDVTAAKKLLDSYGFTSVKMYTVTVGGNL